MDIWCWPWFQYYFKLEDLVILKPLGIQGRSFLASLRGQKVVLKFSSGLKRAHSILNDIQQNKFLQRRMPKVLFNSFFSHFIDPMDSFNLEFKIEAEQYLVSDINCFTIRKYIEGQSLADLSLPNDVRSLRNQLKSDIEFFHQYQIVLRKICLKDVILDDSGAYRLIQLRHAEDLRYLFDEENYHCKIPTFQDDFMALEYFLDFPYQKWNIDS